MSRPFFKRPAAALWRRVHPTAQTSAADHNHTTHAQQQQPQLSINGWTWTDQNTIDDNYMDLALLVARSSVCVQGNMGCALVTNVDDDAGRRTRRADDRHQPVVIAINAPIFGSLNSDCHAEANAIAECAAEGAATRGLCCYVSRIPCSECYKLLARAGISRVVSLQRGFEGKVAASAAEYGISYVQLADTPAREAWRDARAAAFTNRAEVAELREIRKRLRKEHQAAKVLRRAAECRSGGECAPCAAPE